MSKEAIVERILSDAEAEAQAMIAEAEAKGVEVLAAARVRAEENQAETEREISERAKAIADGKAAAARLESAKILLSEKRRVIDAVYARALEKLLSLGEKESVSLAERLLETYAEEGDEVVFAQNFAYADEVCSLPVFAKKKLKVSSEQEEIAGGFMLRGEKADQDLSYAALLAADREEHQGELAAKLFRAR